MKLTTRTQYAVAALIYVKAHDQASPVKLESIATSEAISLHYLEQLFRKLRNAKIVQSVRGPGGGYVLIKRSATYAEIAEAVDEKIDICSDLKKVPQELKNLQKVVRAAFETANI